MVSHCGVVLEMMTLSETSSFYQAKIVTASSFEMRSPLMYGPLCLSSFHLSPCSSFPCLFVLFCMSRCFFVYHGLSVYRNLCCSICQFLHAFLSLYQSFSITTLVVLCLAGAVYHFFITPRNHLSSLHPSLLHSFTFFPFPSPCHTVCLVNATLLSNFLQI